MTMKNKYKVFEPTEQPANKHCPLMDKPCIGSDCTMYYYSTDRAVDSCTFEAIPHFLFPLSIALVELAEMRSESTEPLLGMLETISKQLNSDTK
jgi:hypothetical protein